MDLRLEAAAADELSKILLKMKGLLFLMFLVTNKQRMLVTTWIDGIKINDLDALKTGGHKIDVFQKTPQKHFSFKFFAMVSFMLTCTLVTFLLILKVL